MLGEASAMGRPLFIFDMGDGPGPWWRLPHNFRYKPLSHRFAMRFGPPRMRRDVGNIQDALVEGGQARWLREDDIEEGAAILRAPDAGAAHGNPVGELPEGSNPELERAAEAVRRLVKPR